MEEEQRSRGLVSHLTWGLDVPVRAESGRCHIRSFVLTATDRRRGGLSISVDVGLAICN